MCSLEDFEKLMLTPIHKSYVNTELSMWHRCYLPVGKVVLDVGAGCGETAFFYLNHGAQRVICIEADNEALEMLRRNFGADDRVVIVSAKLDSIKIDIEGGEQGMLLETHFPSRLKTIQKLDGHVRLRRLEQKWAVPSSQEIHALRVRIAHRARLILDKLK